MRPNGYDCRNTVSQTYQQKETMYLHASKTVRQTLYFIRKRAPEEWDPTLLEVRLRPLAKRYKAHWDPTEWEIHIHTHTPTSTGNHGETA